MLAACLAFRAFRMRRRYRTATQIALARGDPLPMQLRDDYWGLAGLPGFPGTDGVTGGVITGEEAEVDGMAPEYRDELFEDITVRSGTMKGDGGQADQVARYATFTLGTARSSNRHGRSTTPI
jgi:hypothetical protein